MVKRRFVHGFGDINPGAYGGGVVFRYDKNVYEIEYTHGSGDGPRAMVYRVRIPLINLVEYYDWIKPEDLLEMSKSLDVSVGSLRKMAKRNATVRDRAFFIECIGSYFGWHELDQCPIELTEEEINRRWGL